MEIWTKFSQIKNGNIYLRVNKKELKAMKAAYEFFLFHIESAKCKMTKDIKGMQKAFKKISEFLE